MAYTLPTFNLIVNLWHGGAVPPAPPDVVTVGNLTPGRRNITPYYLVPVGADAPANMWLLLPRGTDVRDGKAVSGADLAEVPAGSGRYYNVDFVDDLASGFANEHRFCQLRGIGPWPVPFPAGNAALPLIGGATCVLSAQFELDTIYRTTLIGNGPSQWFNMVGPAPLPVTYVIVYTPDCAFTPGLADFGFCYDGFCAAPPTAILFLNGVSPGAFSAVFGSPSPIHVELRSTDDCSIIWSVGVQ